VFIIRRIFFYLQKGLVSGLSMIELESLQKQAIIDLGKFLAHDLARDRVVIVAAGAAAGVAAIA
jgi:hypothetical protein